MKHLYFSYGQHIDWEFEKTLRENNLEYDSGYGFGSRDLDFYFDTEEECTFAHNLLNKLITEFNIYLFNDIEVEDFIDE